MNKNLGLVTGAASGIGAAVVRRFYVAYRSAGVKRPQLLVLPEGNAT